MANTDKRNELQTQALEILRVWRRLILNWGTGVGKSRVAIISMNNILKAVPDARFLLMVQETNHKDNWTTEFHEALGNEADTVLEHVTIDCYASLSKHRNSSWSLIVFDEGHHLRSAIRQDILMTMKAERVLLLTATVSDRNDGEEMLWTLTHTFGPFEHMNFGLQDAIDENILSEPEIHIVPVYLTERYMEKYVAQSEYLEASKTEYFKIKREHGLEYDDPDIEETLPIRQKWLNNGARRKIILGNAKTYAAKRILNGPLKNKRLICFCSSVDQIGWLGGENYVCSRQTQKMNKMAIASFNNGEQNRLFAMGMLQEGQNLRQIEAGLIVQLDGKARSFIQKFGRVMRSKLPVLYILCGVDTHDEGYLETALKDIDPKYIKYDDPIGNAPLKYEVAKESPHTGENELSWITDYSNGVLITNDGILTNELSGRLSSITASDDKTFQFRFTDGGGTCHCVPVKKLLSISLLASLKELAGKNVLDDIITLKTSLNESKYPCFELFGRGGRKIKWNKDFIEGYRASGNDRINWLDSYASYLNSLIH